MYDRARPIDVILVADTDVEEIQRITEILQSAGYTVAATSDLEEAMYLAAVEQFDLLLLDGRMGGLGERRLEERLITQRTTTPTILIGSNRWSASPFPVVCHVERPINPRLLVRLVERFAREPHQRAVA